MKLLPPSEGRRIELVQGSLGAIALSDGSATKWMRRRYRRSAVDGRRYPRVERQPSRMHPACEAWR